MMVPTQIRYHVGLAFSPNGSQFAFSPNVSQLYDGTDEHTQPYQTAAVDAVWLRSGGRLCKWYLPKPVSVKATAT